MSRGIWESKESVRGAGCEHEESHGLVSLGSNLGETCQPQSFMYRTWKPRQVDTTYGRRSRLHTRRTYMHIRHAENQGRGSSRASMGTIRHIPQPILDIAREKVVSHRLLGNRLYSACQDWLFLPIPYTSCWYQVRSYFTSERHRSPSWSAMLPPCGPATGKRPLSPSGKYSYFHR